MAASSPYANVHIPKSCNDLGFGAICSYSSTLALLFLFFVVMVVAISWSLHFLEHWIEHHFHAVSKAGLGAALLDAIERIKEEFMVTGIIAMLLFVIGRDIEKWTCTKLRDSKGDYDGDYKPPGYPSSKYYPPPSRGGRRLFAAKKDYCEEATIPFLEQEYAHILLLLAALVNVVYSIFTIVITLMRIAGWREFEHRLHQSADLHPLTERGILSIARGYNASLFQCLFRQFWIPFLWKGVNYDSFRAARFAAMDFWRPVMYQQMLEKAQDEAGVVLQGQVQILFTPDVEGMDKTPITDNVTDKLIAAAQKFRNETYFLGQAMYEHQRKKRFEQAYRMKVKTFSYLPLLQMLSAEQFAEDRVMAFAMPTIIGIVLMLPHKTLVFSWLPLIVTGMMVLIGFLLQKITLELKRRYHIRYLEEYSSISARLRWRKAITQVAEKNGRPLKDVKASDFTIPKIPDYDQRTKRRILQRANTKYRMDDFDTAELFPFSSPGLIHKIFIFCFYCNGFFLAMVAYTAWIKPEEFRKRTGIMAYLVLFSVICMLHGALNITPLFALITSSSREVPKHFTDNLKAHEEKKRVHARGTVIAAQILKRDLSQHRQHSKIHSHLPSNKGAFMEPLRARYAPGGACDVESQRPTGARQVVRVDEDDVWGGAEHASLISSSTARSN